MAAQGPPPTGLQAARPFDEALSRRIDYIILSLEASPQKSIHRAWWRLQKLIAERHVPAYYPDGGQS